MTEKIKKSLDFVVRHYQPGVFRPDLTFMKASQSFWKRHAAAAAATIVALAAAAAVTTYVVIRQNKRDAYIPVQTATIEPTLVTPRPAAPLTDTQEIKKIEFENASLPDVISAIEATYHVKVSGQCEGYPSLTLSYQGSAEDLIATINDLLGTNLKIEK